MVVKLRESELNHCVKGDVGLISENLLLRRQEMTKPKG